LGDVVDGDGVGVGGPDEGHAPSDVACPDDEDGPLVEAVFVRGPPLGLMWFLGAFGAVGRGGEG
jgi:hypothetical protein